MVRSGNRPYRTSAQNHGGGTTRRQQLAQSLRDHKRRLREQGLEDVVFGAKPIALAPRDDEEYGVYGVFKHEGEWVLAGLSVTNRVERMSSHRGGGYSRTEVRGRWVARPDCHPTEGITIDTFESKKAALAYVSANASERIESGVYIVRPSHEPRTRHEEVDKDEYQAFKRNVARRVRGE